MSVRSAQSVTVDFTTRVASTSVGTNADSLPTGTLVLNGTDNGATVTVTNVSTGVYKAAVTLPTLAIGDIVSLRIAATVSSISDAAIVWTDTKDVALDSSGDVTFNNTTLATVTTTTNLTNAATAGDFTSTMKTSIGTAVAASAVASVTAAVTLPAIPANWITSAGVNAGALNGKGDWLISSSYPTHFNLLGISGTGAISEVVLCDTITTYTGNTPQTGDSFARIGALGAGLTALASASTALSSSVWTAPPTGFLAATFPSGTIASTTNITAGTITTVTTTTTATNLTNAPTAGDFTATMKTSIGTAVAGSAVASVTAAVQVGSYASGHDPATLVLGATAASWDTAGTIGAEINAAGGSGDPWTTSLPGSYSAGQAGYIIGHTVGPDVAAIFAKLPAGNIADETLLAAIGNAILAVLGTPADGSVSADILAANAAIAAISPSAIATAVLTGANGITTGFSLARAIRCILAAEVGNSSGVPVQAPVYLDPGTGAPAVSGSAVAGNRSGMTWEA